MAFSQARVATLVRNTEMWFSNQFHDENSVLKETLKFMSEDEIPNGSPKYNMFWGSLNPKPDPAPAPMTIENIPMEVDEKENKPPTPPAPSSSSEDSAQAQVPCFHHPRYYCWYFEPTGPQQLLPTAAQQPVQQPVEIIPPPQESPSALDLALANPTTTADIPQTEPPITAALAQLEETTTVLSLILSEPKPTAPLATAQSSFSPRAHLTPGADPSPIKLSHSPTNSASTLSPEVPTLVSNANGEPIALYAGVPIHEPPEKVKLQLLSPGMMDKVFPTPRSPSLTTVDPIKAQTSSRPEINELAFRADIQDRSSVLKEYLSRDHQPRAKEHQQSLAKLILELHHHQNKNLIPELQVSAPHVRFQHLLTTIHSASCSRTNAHNAQMNFSLVLIPQMLLTITVPPILRIRLFTDLKIYLEFVDSPNKFDQFTVKQVRM